MNRLTLSTMILILSVFAASCDAPVRNRYITSGKAQDFEDDNPDGVVSGEYPDTTDDISDSGGLTGDGDDSGQDEDQDSSEPGFENCNLARRYDGGSLGTFGICQSSQDERHFKASIQGSSDGTCFVPLHIEGSGDQAKSYNVGRAECTRKSGVVFPYLYKSRPETVNGVMVIKASSVNSFMQCMSAKADYINANPGCLYNSSCVATAEQQARYFCGLFVQHHGNHYRQVRFYE